MLRAELAARDVTILRAYAKYLRRAGAPFSNAYMERALTGNPEIAARLVTLFITRFDPAGPETARAERCQQLLEAIDSALDQFPASTRTASCACSSA